MAFGTMVFRMMAYINMAFSLTALSIMTKLKYQACLCCTKSVYTQCHIAILIAAMLGFIMPSVIETDRHFAVRMSVVTPYYNTYFRSRGNTFVTNKSYIPAY
jgi:hypothetical protein